MTTFLLLLKYFFWSVLCTLLQVVFLSVTKLLLEYNFRVLFTPLLLAESNCTYAFFQTHIRTVINLKCLESQAEEKFRWQKNWRF